MRHYSLQSTPKFRHALYRARARTHTHTHTNEPSINTRVGQNMSGSTCTEFTQHDVAFRSNERLLSSGCFICSLLLYWTYNQGYFLPCDRSVYHHSWNCLIRLRAKANLQQPKDIRDAGRCDVFLQARQNTCCHIVHTLVCMHQFGIN